MLDTTLRFDGDRRFDVEQTAVSASASWQLNPRWTARAGLGVVTGGSLTSATGAVHDFKPGGLISFAAERRGSAGSGWTPSLDYSLALGATWAKTEAPDTTSRTGYFAADLRLGARASWLLAGRTMGYAAARVFGGPVNWEIEGDGVMGTDTHHYQLAAGLASQVGSVGLFAEWAALGEQGFSAGLSTVW
jgi:hypothetical protein